MYVTLISIKGRVFLSIEWILIWIKLSNVTVKTISKYKYFNFNTASQNVHQPFSGNYNKINVDI